MATRRSHNRGGELAGHCVMYTPNHHRVVALLLILLLLSYDKDEEEA
jgi:hypothetical protein